MFEQFIGLLFFVGTLYLLYRFVRGKHEAIVDVPEPGSLRVALHKSSIALMQPIDVPKIEVIGRG